MRGVYCCILVFWKQVMTQGPQREKSRECFHLGRGDRPMAYMYV